VLVPTEEFVPQLSRRFAIAALASVLGLVVQAAPPAASTVAASSPANPALAMTAPKAFTEPSQMYLDDQAHAHDKLGLTPGGPPTVPYQPRPSDRWSVGGQRARAIPLTSSSTGSSGSSSSGSTTSAQTGTGPLTSTTTSTSTPGLGREVFGFLGYWGLTDPIDYTGLTTLAYFGVDATSSGGFASNSGLTGWNSSALTSVINTAHSNGVRVVLVVKCFAWTSSGTTTCSTLLSSATARQKLADTIASQVAARNVDGVNFDFEPIPQSSAESANFVDLVRRTRAALDQQALGYEVTVDSLGWIGPASYQTTYGYDVAGLTAPGGADAMVIMGYDYKGAFQSAAGSIDPLSGPAYDLADTVNAYLQFTDPGHVILALPWYGRAWSTTTSSAGSATVAGTSLSRCFPRTRPTGTRRSRALTWATRSRRPPATPTPRIGASSTTTTSRASASDTTW
jgi:Glycosyl hydrolases family 18